VGVSLATTDPTTVVAIGVIGLLALVGFVLWVHPSTPWGWSA
jgi:hypothetical protein